MTGVQTCALRSVDVFFQCYGFSEGFADDDVPVDSGVGEDDVVEGSEFFVADAVVFNDCIDWEVPFGCFEVDVGSAVEEALQQLRLPDVVMLAFGEQDV